MPEARILTIKPYTLEDRTAVLQLLEENTPEFFAPSEKADLENYLDREAEEYFVVEEEGRIIGCGGINYFPKKARISWDIISPDSQGKGIGSALVRHRIEHINKKGEFDLIEVRTSQIAYKFYEKMGFELLNIEKDFWAEDYHLYQMERKTEA